MVQVTFILNGSNIRPVAGGDVALPCTSVPVDHR